MADCRVAGTVVGMMLETRGEVELARRLYCRVSLMTTEFQQGVQQVAFKAQYNSKLQEFET